MPSFRYLGQTMMVTDNDWPEFVGKLWRSIWTRARLSWVLSGEGAEMHTSGNIYLKVVQAIRIFGSKTWVFTPYIGITHEVSTTRSRGVSQGSNLGNEPMESGSNPLCWSQCGRWYWRNQKQTFLEDKSRWTSR